MTLEGLTRDVTAYALAENGASHVMSLFQPEVEMPAVSTKKVRAQLVEKGDSNAKVTVSSVFVLSIFQLDAACQLLYLWTTGRPK
jgi:hypothetical protein